MNSLLPDRSAFGLFLRSKAAAWRHRSGGSGDQQGFSGSSGSGVGETAATGAALQSAVQERAGLAQPHRRWRGVRGVRGVAAALWELGQTPMSLPIAVLVVGLALSAGLAEQTRRMGQAAHERIERALLDDVADAVEVKLREDVDTISGVAGLFNASTTVTRAEFRRFYDSLKWDNDSMAGIQGLGFTQFLTSSDQDQLIAQVRSEGYGEFRIRPAIKQRAIGSAILYLEPFNLRNQRAFGFDMYSESTRRTAMDRAAQTGLPSMSGAVRLVQENNSEVQAGVLIYVPIYRHGVLLPPRQPQQYTKTLLGWAYSPIRVGDLVTAALRNVNNPDLTGSAVQVFDGPSPQSREIFHNPAATNPNEIHDAQYQPITVAGRTWLVGIQLSREQIGPQGWSSQVLMVGLIGGMASVISSLITAMLLQNHRSTEKALAIARKANQERALAATVFETSPQAIVVTDALGRVVSANQSFARITGYSSADILGRTLSLLRSGRHDSSFYATLWASVKQHGSWHGEIWNRTRQGEIRRHELSITAVRDSELQITQMVGMLQDVTERYEAQELIRHRAMHDDLTGLPSRAMLLERLEEDLVRCATGRCHVGVLYLDLDGFKPVNDRYGHACGDDLLRLVARRLRAGLHSEDLLARLGGDEFVILVPHSGALNDLRALAERVNTLIRSCADLFAHQLTISASIGIARSPEHGATAGSLLAAADAAMYEAKRTGTVAVAAEEVRQDS